MKIFSAKQIREGDVYTIRHEPVSSVELMERASKACAKWITGRFPATQPIYIFCGTGNNGGDGLALTRILQENGYIAFAYVVGDSGKLSEDCKTNRTLLEHHFGAHLFAIHERNDFPVLPENAIIIDALFGTGLNRPLEGIAAEVVIKINKENRMVIAIDMPSGLMADKSSSGNIIKANHTLSFEFYKLAFLFPENALYTGQVHILPIGIHQKYMEDTATPYEMPDDKFIRSVFKKRNNFSHKGVYGHALIIAGSFGKMGAAVLATKACLRGGAGLVTGYIPLCGYNILQTAIPEAMCMCDPFDQYLSRIPENIESFDVVGIGPGIGEKEETVAILREFLSKYTRPVVLDADALNIIGKEKWLNNIAPESILTPHPKEFERLFGKTNDSFQRLAVQVKESKTRKIFIILKGHYTCITSPDGRCYFNSTGNPGMATAGSGDVLTGILTALLAQGYTPLEASLLGVYLHGMAGDIAAENKSMESMVASDIISALGKAFQELGSSV